MLQPQAVVSPKSNGHRSHAYLSFQVPMVYTQCVQCKCIPGLFRLNIPMIIILRELSMQTMQMCHQKPVGFVCFSDLG